MTGKRASGDGKGDAPADMKSSMDAISAAFLIPVPLVLGLVIAAYALRTGREANPGRPSQA